MSSSSDWRNVRVKEEPVSDYEGASGSRRYNDRGGNRGRRDRRERFSPSPPPSHSKSKSRRFSRSRSRSLSRERERSRRRERNRSRERYREAPPMVKQERDRDNRRGEYSGYRDRSRYDSRRIKQEPISRSRSPLPPPPPDRWSREDRRDRPRTDNRQNAPDKPRDKARERDWNNFLNPNSDMSKEANIKREKEENNGKQRVAVGGSSGDFGKQEDKPEDSLEKEQPNFGLSGKLTEETNTFRGVVIKYSEPPEARKPNKIRWRLYPFKGKEELPVMHIHRQSAFLVGRERKVCDISMDHPSISKQHAVLQFRLVPYTRPDGSKGRRIRPYLIDLESANGTFVNGNQIDAKRYVELFEKDVLKFGFSSREYVLLHAESKDVEDDCMELTPD